MINSLQIPRAFSEVYSFLNALGDDYIKKIPIWLYNTIKEERDKNYTPIYKDSENIVKYNISQEGLTLISAINIQYWCTNEEKKKFLKETYINNTTIENQKHSYENLFINNKNKEK